jgi:hypothetical protein
VDVGSTGAVPPEVGRELEALRLRLSSLGADDPADRFVEVADEISAIRLGLEQLRAELEPATVALKRSLGLAGS